tara:strand:- start:520 stop:759 length:240 start_codon:yes stop_codon:yes gene_type:complete
MDSAQLIDMIANDAPANEVSDAIKTLAYAKSADMVDNLTPNIAAGLFGDEVPEEQPEVEAEQPEANAEVEQEPTTETEE